VIKAKLEQEWIKYRAAARADGWDVFFAEDSDGNESYQIWALDDPHGVAADDGREYKGPKRIGMDRDKKVVDELKSRAAKGDMMAKSALAFIRSKNQRTPKP